MAAATPRASTACTGITLPIYIFGLHFVFTYIEPLQKPALHMFINYSSCTLIIIIIDGGSNMDNKKQGQSRCWYQMNLYEAESFDEL
jgi:hypothetical protein